MDMMIGKPYSFRYFNCWHYAAAIREQAKIKTPRFSPQNISEAFDLITSQMQALGHGLKRVHAVQDYDIVIGKKTKAGRLDYHCGVYVGGRVFHCHRGKGQVTHDQYDEFCGIYSEVSLWR